MRFFGPLLLQLLVLLAPAHLCAQTAPASPILQTLGPIDAESDQKASVITMRYDTKPAFTKPVAEAHGSFIQVVLPHTMVLKPGVFVEAKSPYIRKFTVIQLDEDTAALRLFVTKEAEHLVGAVTVDILENRVLVIMDHERAEKELLANFNGVPVQGGPSPEQVVKGTEVRKDIPDPIALMGNAKADPNTIAAASPTAVPEGASVAMAGTVSKTKAKKAVLEEAPKEKWTDGIENKLVAVTIFCAVMLGLLVAIKSWRRVAVKALAPGADFSLKTLATHALGPKQRITVIQVGQEQILLGVSPDGINFLTSLKPQAAEPRIQLDPSMYQRTLSPSPKRPAARESQGVEPLQKSRTPESRSDRPEPGSSIRYGVGDAGIKNFKDEGHRDQESLEDVTRLIRKKLKDLPKV
ncbi:MAG: flagellar biosynthetic protein FliO [Chitinophagaceae bacterium]|nr:flagellar biosynthetic protein FliO [Oligoflexus sp.]